MPRRARLDFPGAFQHVMTRGVAQQTIFADDKDREVFLKYLGDDLLAAKMRCYAWVLMTNHVHLLVRTAAVGLPKVMQKLLTRYAVYYNHRHQRSGHLFQNRYKSILGEKETYFLALVRYIHLNPIAAGLADGLDALAGYPWSGHTGLAGGNAPAWQDVDFVLSQFGNEMGQARAAYLRFAAEGLEERTEGGGGELDRGARGAGPREVREAETRILGSGPYVERVLKEAEKRDRRRDWLGKRLTPVEVIVRAAQAAGVSTEELKGNNKRAPVVQARCLACKWLVEDLGLRGVEVARLLGVTGPTVCRSAAEGRKVERLLGVRLGVRES